MFPVNNAGNVGKHGSQSKLITNSLMRVSFDFPRCHTEWYLQI